MKKSLVILLYVLLMLVLVVGMLGAYQLGVRKGENNVIEQMHIDTIEENYNGEYDVLFTYKCDQYLHTWYPWWLHMTAEEAFQK